MIGVPIAALFNLVREQARQTQLAQLRAQTLAAAPQHALDDRAAQAAVLDRMRARSQATLMGMAAQRGVAPLGMYGAQMDPAMVQAMMARR
jgi:hypothetical protein